MRVYTLLYPLSTIKLYKDLGTLNLIIINLMRDIIKNMLLEGKDTINQLIYYELRELFTNMISYGESSNDCTMSMFLNDIANTLEGLIKSEDLINGVMKFLGSDARKIIEDIVSEDIVKSFKEIDTHSVKSLRRLLLGELLRMHALESDQERKEVLDVLLNLMRYLVDDIGRISVFWKFMNEILPRNLLTLLSEDPFEVTNLRLAITLLAMLALNYINRGEKCVDISPPQYKIVKRGRGEPRNYETTTKYILNTIINMVMKNNGSPCSALCQSIYQASGLGLTLKDYLHSLTQIEPYFARCYKELFKHFEGIYKDKLLMNLANQILSQIFTLRDTLKHTAKRDAYGPPVECREFYGKLVKCLSQRELVGGKSNSLVSGEDIIKLLERLRKGLHNYLNQELPLLIYALASICSGNIVVPHVKVTDIRGDVFIDDVDLLVISIKRDMGGYHLILIPYLIEVSTRKLKIYVSNVNENNFMFTAYLKGDSYLLRKYRKLLKVVEEFEDIYALMFIDIVVSNKESSKLDHLERVKCIVKEHPICLYSPEASFGGSCLVLADIKGYANPLLFNALLDIVRDLRYYGINYGAVSSMFTNY